MSETVICTECGTRMEAEPVSSPLGIGGKPHHLIGARLCGPLAPTSDKRSTEPDPLPPREET